MEYPAMLYEVIIRNTTNKRPFIAVLVCCAKDEDEAKDIALLSYPVDHKISIINVLRVLQPVYCVSEKWENS